MRPIDADKIEYDFNIKTYADNRVMITKLLADKDTIDAMPTVEPEQRWILVTERLPNKDGLYLVTTSKGQVQVHVFSHNGNSEEYWMRCNKAWMPMPEPYETESEG